MASHDPPSTLFEPNKEINSVSKIVPGRLWSRTIQQKEDKLEETAVVTLN